LVIVALLSGLLLLGLVLQDAFEVMLLPRRVVRRWRIMRGFFRATWKAWTFVGRLLQPGAPR
jgi:hypothetical protein